MIKPYYEEPGITIYNADCRDVLPQLEPVDLVLTDPPYNAKKDYGAYNDNLDDDEYEMVMSQYVSLSLPLAKNQFWVAPRYKLSLWFKLLPNSHLIVIRRGASGPFRGGWSDQFEIALAVGKPSKCIPDLWDGIRLKGEGYFFREETYGHPGYTPIHLIKRAMNVLSDKSVIDPCMGTGTTLRAAKDLGRKAIGIEIEEKYCQIAVDRLRQGVLI